MALPETFESVLAAPAKINLHLHIKGIREDGYHELRTLFYPVYGLYDTIRIESSHDDHMYMRCPENPELETSDNLIYKAWKAYGEATGFQPGLFVTLTKKTPMGGGLGGGSSDAAALLRWLNENADAKALSAQKLNALAAKLGADVPFFLTDGPAWACGIGEQLTPAEVDLAGMTILLAFPNIHIDTAWAFKRWDEINRSQHAEERLTTSDLGNKNPSLVSPKDIVNDFESVVFEKHPILRTIKETLIIQGASAAAMSGSGASLFGLYRSRQSAEKAALALRENEIEIFTTTCS